MFEMATLLGRSALLGTSLTMTVEMGLMAAPCTTIKRIMSAPWAKIATCFS